MKKILSLIVVIIVFSSCVVSKEKYEILQKKYNDMKIENEDLRNDLANIMDKDSDKEDIKNRLENCLFERKKEALISDNFYINKMNCDQYPENSIKESACLSVVSDKIDENEVKFKEAKEECYKRYEIDLKNL